MLHDPFKRNCESGQAELWGNVMKRGHRRHSGTEGEVPADAAPALPALDRLHERHIGLTRSVCLSYAEAASVTLSCHHSSPTVFSISSEVGHRQRSVRWSVPDERTCRAWANSDDSTRDGACALALSAMECELGWVALARAETRSGADYYVGRADMEGAHRLEISGTDRGDEGYFRRRLERKLRQASRGNSALPALACVVGFKIRQIVIARARRGT
jgi:hypothetical protein